MGYELTKLIFLAIFRILCHNDFIMILYWTYKFRFKVTGDSFIIDKLKSYLFSPSF